MLFFVFAGQQPLTRCCDSRLRCRGQRDRNARAQGRFQGVVSGLAILQPFRANFACENHEKTYLAVSAFDNSRGDACDRGEELGADPPSHN